MCEFIVFYIVTSYTLRTEHRKFLAMSYLTLDDLKCRSRGWSNEED